MRGGGSVFRLVCIFALCITILGYHFYGSLFKGIETLPGTASDFADSDEPEEPSAGGETASDSAVSETESKTEPSPAASESAPAAASGTVKGKIISNYISPYKAGLSYNHVYVKNSTDLKIDIKSLLAAPLTFKIKKDSDPQVLIMHTHTTETYMTENTDYYTESFSSRTRDTNKNMVSVGNIVAERLNNAGIKTLHDTTEHDYPQYTGSYTRAAKTIHSYLKKYPSIKIVLDLHRDAVSSGDSDKVKLVTEIAGKKAAQVMLVMGSQSGGVTNFPNWQENLKLALRLQQVLEVNYPTLARPLSLMPKNYNESITNGSLLIEFGTDANTVEEAHYSAEMVGDALASLLNTLT